MPALCGPGEVCKQEGGEGLEQQSWSAHPASTAWHVEAVSLVDDVGVLQGVGTA